MRRGGSMRRWSRLGISVLRHGTACGRGAAQQQEAPSVGAFFRRHLSFLSNLRNAASELRGEVGSLPRGPREAAARSRRCCARRASCLVLLSSAIALPWRPSAAAAVVWRGVWVAACTPLAVRLTRVHAPLPPRKGRRLPAAAQPRGPARRRGAAVRGRRRQGAPSSSFALLHGQRPVLCQRRPFSDRLKRCCLPCYAR